MENINQRACYNRSWSWSSVLCEKHGPQASVTKKTEAEAWGFCLLSSSGHVFHMAWKTMIKSYINDMCDIETEILSFGEIGCTVNYKLTTSDTGNDKGIVKINAVLFLWRRDHTLIQVLILMKRWEPPMKCVVAEYRFHVISRIAFYFVQLPLMSQQSVNVHYTALHA